MNNSATQISDHEAVAKVIARYLKGAKTGNSDDMRPAFHEDATIFGYIGPDLLAGSIRLLFGWNDENGPATGLRARVAHTDIVGTAATTRVEIENWRGHRFTDLFTLLKVDGTWKIMNKVFHLHPTAVNDLTHD